MTLTPDDLVFAGACRTGTSWLQTILHRIHHQAAAPDDWVYRGVPYLEIPIGQDKPRWLDTTLPEEERLKSRPSSASHFAFLSQLPLPGIYKTHLSPHFLGEGILDSGCKIIALFRNPKDHLVSFYHYYHDNFVLGHFKGTWDEFFEYLVKEKRLAYGDWFDFVNQWWGVLHNRPNSMILTYEDLRRAPEDVVSKLAAFCQIDLKPETLATIVKETGFQHMKDNDTMGWKKSFQAQLFPEKDVVSMYFRKGVVGDWKNYFTKEQNDYIDERYEQLQRRTGLCFDFGL